MNKEDYEASIRMIELERLQTKLLAYLEELYDGLPDFEDEEEIAEAEADEETQWLLDEIAEVEDRLAAVGVKLEIGAEWER